MTVNNKKTILHNKIRAKKIIVWKFLLITIKYVWNSIKINSYMYVVYLLINIDHTPPFFIVQCISKNIYKENTSHQCSFLCKMLQLTLELIFLYAKIIGALYILRLIWNQKNRLYLSMMLPGPFSIPIIGNVHNFIGLKTSEGKEIILFAWTGLIYLFMPPVHRKTLTVDTRLCITRKIQT